MIRAADSNPKVVAEVRDLVPGLEDYIRRGMEAFDVPGLAIGIVAGDDLIYAGGFGVRAKSDNKAVDTGTVFQIGSATKAFLATTMAIAVDGGKLGWDDRVVDLDPGFQLKDAWVTSEFRVFDLLAQRSGLPPYVNDFLGALGYDEQAKIRSLRHVEPVSSFRSSFAYTNITHLIAGRIVADAEGAADWGTVLQRELLDPLGMEDSTLTAAAIEAAPNHSRGHRYTLEGTVEIPFDQRFPYDFLGAGAINSTIEDMAAWVRLLLGDGTFEGQSIVSPENLAVTRIARVGMSDTVSYAMGWVIQQTPNGTVVWHNGGTDGYGAYVGIEPARKIGLVVLTNETNVGFPDALGAWTFDRLLDNPSVDYVAVKLEETTERLTEQAKLFAKPAEPRPFPPLAPRVGAFKSPVFGEAAVTAAGDALVLALEETGAHLMLEPWDGDIFTVRLMPDSGFASIAEALGPQPVAFGEFLAGTNGKLDQLRLTFPENNQVYEFRRD